MYTIEFENPCHIYFIGIGGVSMSGLAMIFAKKGFPVSGSDRQKSETCTRLESMGIHVFYGQRTSNITADIDVVVLTSAIKDGNPELEEAKRLGLPLLSRGQLMGQLMKHYAMPIGVSGTHGKTTTTSMLSEILMGANTDPTLFVGGNLPSIDGNLRIGDSDYFVTEACEYTNSFLSFFPKAALILNIEEDHLDFFKDIDDIRHSFRQFATLLPEDGCLVINKDIPNLEEITDGLCCKVVTFSIIGEADYSVKNITHDNGLHRFTLVSAGRPDEEFTLRIPGIHNIANAIASIAMADYLKVERPITRAALESFGGTDRRFQHKGTICGVEIVDDYAHHPSEIRATLTAAREATDSRIWCVFQPHTFTRTKAFMKEFAQALSLADEVVLADIYAARETDNLGISSETLQKEIQALGHNCYYFKTFDEIENFLLGNCTKGDLLITMGAGDVVKIGENLLGIK